MTTIDRAVKMAESGIGYSYDKAVLIAACEAGFAGIPDEAIIATAGDQTIIKRGVDLVCVKGGVVTKTTPCDTDAVKDNAVIMYAVTVSKRGYKVGV